MRLLSLQMYRRFWGKASRRWRTEGEPKTEKSEAFNMELKYFEGTVTFVQRVKLKKDKAKLVGYIEYMSCSGGQCIPPAEEEFEFELTK